MGAVRGRFSDLSWSKPVLRAPAVHGVSSVKSGNRKAGNGIESQNVARNDALWREYTPFRAEIAGNKKGGNGNQSRKQAGNSRHSRPIWLGTGNYGGTDGERRRGRGEALVSPSID